MAFLIYERCGAGATQTLQRTGETFSLGGHGLIFRAWQERGRPINKGWDVGIDELIRLHSNGARTASTHAFIVDYDPSSRTRLALIELLHICVYTYGDPSAGRATFSPLLLRFRDTLTRELDSLVPREAATIEIPAASNASEFIEFLYLNGDDKGWRWGRNGQTNAVFIEQDARAYFRPFF